MMHKKVVEGRVNSENRPYKTLLIATVLTFLLIPGAQGLWWNNDFDLKRSITANCTECSGAVISPILINDTAFFINQTPQYVWCNYTVGLTPSVVGWLYYNNETDYVCINAAETARVEIDVDEGNSTDFGNSWGNDAVGLWHLDDVNDSGLYGNNGTATGAVRIDGMIGHAFDFDGAGDSITFVDQPEFNMSNII